MVVGRVLPRTFVFLAVPFFVLRLIFFVLAIPFSRRDSYVENWGSVGRRVIWYSMDNWTNIWIWKKQVDRVTQR